MKIHALIIPLLVCKVGLAAPILSSVAEHSGHTYFSLREGRDATWVEVGDKFGQYRIKQYDAGTGMLTLDGPAGEVKLELAKATISTSTAEPEGFKGRELAELVMKSYRPGPGGDRQAAIARDEKLRPIEDLILRHKSLEERVAKLVAEAEASRLSGRPVDEEFNKNLAIQRELLKVIDERLRSVAEAFLAENPEKKK